jgi:hypothetical protein
MDCTESSASIRNVASQLTEDATCVTRRGIKSGVTSLAIVIQYSFTPWDCSESLIIEPFADCGADRCGRLCTI